MLIATEEIMTFFALERNAPDKVILGPDQRVLNAPKPYLGATIRDRRRCYPQECA